MERHIQKLFVIVAACLAGGPLIYYLAFDSSLSISTLYILAFVGWVIVTLLLGLGVFVNTAVENASRQMELELPRYGFRRRLINYLEESLRLYRASYTLQSPENSGDLKAGGKKVAADTLSKSLERIVETAYNELSAKSAELSLFDEGSGLWTQAIIVGEPSSLLSQSQLLEASSQKESEFSDEARAGVLTQPLSFAGKFFGALRIEFPRGYKPTKVDSQVLYFLAASGALALIDARFTDELLRMRRLSDESVQAKTGFLANLSHEIRGPLGVILNGSELALDGLCGAVSEQMRETLTMIKDNGEHLLDLVNDVLDYAKVESGKITANPVELQVKDLLDDLAMVVRSQAQSKNHKLHVEEIEKSWGVICDKRHIRQILINLLTNAIKYTPDGGVISLGAERVAGNRVKLFVRDTGVGIPDSERDKVFGAFERVNNKYSLAQTGTGLGMPLTQQLARVNRGKVDFSSEEGKGSTFWVTLPSCEMAAVVSTESAGSEPSVADEVKGHGEVVLLVDSEGQERKMLTSYLEHCGFKVITAATGLEVMKALRVEGLKVALIQNDLPELPGEDVVSVIRSNPVAAGVPIVLLSAKAFVFDVERFLKMGVERCLAKPVELKEVALTVSRLIA